MSSIDELIKRPHSRVFRRAFIKRRELGTGTYEPDWTEISQDVKSWGTLKTTVDITQYNRFKFAGFRLKVANDQGQFGPEYVESSVWSGFASPQRSLVKIEVGYLDQSLGADGIYTNTEYPQDGGTVASTFIGVLVGDMPTSDRNDVSLPVQPLTEVFRQYPAEAISGYTSTGLTAQQFIENVRDHQDANGNYIFRPFFGDTTSGFAISSTTVNYTDLNTSGSDSVADKNVWEIIERLAQAETFVPFVSKDGVFTFGPRTANQTTATYNFYGAGFNDRTYGHNVKRINRFGLKYTKFYSRVRVKFQEADTVTSYRVVESSLTVATDSLPWLYGHKTIEIENLWIPNSTTAATIAQGVFDQVSNLRDEITFTAPLIPQLEIFDRISVSYDTNPTEPTSLWDANDWAPDLFTDQTTASEITGLDGSSGPFAIGNQYQYAQTFTIPSSYTFLHYLEIPIALTLDTDSNTAHYVEIEVRQVSSSNPGSLVTRSEPVLKYDIPFGTATASTFTRFNFNESPDLTTGATYFWVVNYLNTGSLDRFKIIQTQTTTTESWARRSTDGGSTWPIGLGREMCQTLGFGDGVLTDPDDALIWDKNTGDAINLNESEFALLSIENNLDKLETKITARKT